MKWWNTFLFAHWNPVLLYTGNPRMLKSFLSSASKVRLNNSKSVEQFTWYLREIFMRLKSFQLHKFFFLWIKIVFSLNKWMLSTRNYLIKNNSNCPYVHTFCILLFPTKHFWGHVFTSTAMFSSFIRSAIFLTKPKVCNLHAA